MQYFFTSTSRVLCLKISNRKLIENRGRDLFHISLFGHSEIYLLLRRTWRSCFWMLTAWMIGKLNFPSVKSSQKLLLSEYCNNKKKIRNQNSIKYLVSIHFSYILWIETVLVYLFANQIAIIIPDLKV